MTQHDNAKVASLGYIGIGVKDIDAWKDFAQNVLGLQIAGEGPDGATLLRMDEYSRRFMLHPTGEDDIIFSGFEVPAVEEFEADQLIEIVAVRILDVQLAGAGLS